MKKYILLAITLATVAASVNAQSFKIVKTDGTVDTFNNDDIACIEFSSETVAPQPNVGDYYFSDGTWGPDASAGTAIGRVFYTGLGDGDSESNYTVSDFVNGQFHGYVVALEDASNMAQWDVLPSVIQDYLGTSKSSSDFAGFANTQIVKGQADDFSYSFPAAYAAVNYSSKVGAPESSSGWYLPSAGQLKAVVDYDSNILSEQSYWTSSEYSDTNAYYLSYSWISGHVCTDYGKSNACRLRAILAF